MTVEIVAEIGASHGQDLARAKRLCRGAIDAGADSVKLQTYTPDTISFPAAGVCPSGPWQGRPLYDLYREAHMPRPMQADLIRWLDVSGIRWFSTPFSPEDVAWLEGMGCQRYKISSFDVENAPLVDAVLGTGKPVVVSDGCSATVAMEVALRARESTLLRCVSAYPAHPEDYALDDAVRGSWGISDHTHGCELGIVAIGMGARMIEKHVRDNDDDQTADADFATPLCLWHTLTAAWRRAERIRDARGRKDPDLAAIRPRPVTIDGRTVWRRCAG